jgi:hypothetical protein
MTPQMRNSHQRRQDRAHRRLLQSLKALGMIRMKALAVQVNVSQRVNIGNPPVPADNLGDHANLDGLIAARVGKN